MNRLAIYPYGSQVYRTTTVDSDNDFVIVAEDEKEVNSANDYFNNLKQIYNNFKNDYQFYTLNQWKQMLESHHPCAVECYFLPKNLILKDIELDFKLDKQKLRHSFSQVISNSYVKAKKKFLVEKDCEKIGKKSLFHSFRLIDFAIQLGTHGKIVDYSSCNKLFEEIMACESWPELESKFKVRHNNAMTEFRKICPK